MIDYEIIYKKIGDYEYFESSKEFYYISNLKIIIDNEKKILMDSNINLHNQKYFELSKKNVNDIDLKTSKCCIYEKIICIQNWFETYGHFKDELFNLYNFYSLFNDKDFNVLMNYSSKPHLSYSFDNYDELSNLLFESNNFINASKLNDNLIKINKLVFIKHNFQSPMFHMFPKICVDKILDKTNTIDTDYNKNIFITRGKALHLPRNLENQEELEHYFLSKKYDVINPEIINIKLFINRIKNCENIYITWGGTMVNLCYVNPNTNIYLLQSLSYKHEEIFSIFKFLRNYKNLYLIKCNNENKIDINFIDDNLIHLKYC